MIAPRNTTTNVPITSNMICCHPSNWLLIINARAPPGGYVRDVLAMTDAANAADNDMRSPSDNPYSDRHPTPTPMLVPIRTPQIVFRG